MLFLPDQDAMDLRSLRSFGVLIDVRPEFINLKNGLVLNLCSDCDQLHDIYMYHWDMMTKAGWSYPRIQWYADNGGALVISPDSPLNEGDRGNNLIISFKRAIKMKKMETIALYAHAPCGLATEAKMPALQQIKWLKDADTIIQNKFPGVQALCFFQVYWGGTAESRRTYFVHGERWREYQKQHNLV